MPFKPALFKPPFSAASKKNPLTIYPCDEKSFSALKKDRELSKLAKTQDFKAKGGQILFVYKNGAPNKIYLGLTDPVSLYDSAKLVKVLQDQFGAAYLKPLSFKIESRFTNKEALEKICIGWGLAAHQFDRYKKNGKVAPQLVWPKGVDKKRISAAIEAVCLIRDLVNTPANEMGPEELEKTARFIAGKHDATIKAVSGAALKKDFPLIHMVGDSSPRRPRLIDMRWGDIKHPKLTLVGKGVCFDTGGLDLKPSKFMRHMKKDMGGGAHALALAHMIMALKLPVRLRLLIPAVENSVSGAAFRPGDIVKSRKGLTVENTNTDAEGRLILADALTLASEEKPDLIIDFATLTGSARAALGPDIPAFFTNNENTAQTLRDVAFNSEDPLWPMPLWQPYRKTIESDTADLVNSAGTPGDLIYSALFLESFLEGAPPWIHLDIFAWENKGKPGRPKNGADTGLRGVFAFLEERFG